MRTHRQKRRHQCYVSDGVYVRFIVCLIVTVSVEPCIAWYSMWTAACWKTLSHKQLSVSRHADTRMFLFCSIQAPQALFSGSTSRNLFEPNRTLLTCCVSPLKSCALFQVDINGRRLCAHCCISLSHTQKRKKRSKVRTRWPTAERKCLLYRG